MTHGLNWWTWDSHAPPMGWFLVDFFIFVLGLWALAGRPLGRAFAQRHNRIKRAIGDAAAAHARASARHTEARNRLSGSEAEVRAMLSASQTDGAAERDQIVAAARTYAAQLGADSAQRAEQEVHRARGRLRRALVRKLFARARDLAASELTDADQQHLLEAAIVELEAEGPLPPPRHARVRSSAAGARPAGPR